MARLRVYLSRSGTAEHDFFDEIEAEADALAARLRHNVLTMTDPAPVTMFEHVYREDHAGLAAERAWFERYESSFADTQGSSVAPPGGRA